MKVQDLVLKLAKERGIDEVLVTYPAKLEVKENVALRALCRERHAVCPLPIDRARSILKEYYSCALIIGEKKEGFAEHLLAMETELRKIGHYKAWAILNEPITPTVIQPCHEWFNIDIVATLRRFKKNLATPQPGEYPPWAIMLLE